MPNASSPKPGGECPWASGRPLTDVKAIADPAKRAAALVDLLDEVAARQQGQPGGVDYDDDPIVATLIELGEPAVEALIACVESDERSTRTGVLLARLCRQPEHQQRPGRWRPTPSTRSSRNRSQRSPCARRQYGRPLESRRGRRPRLLAEGQGRAPSPNAGTKTLADDKAAGPLGAGAAMQIVDRQPKGQRRYWYLSRPSPGDKYPLRGEVLRGQTKPSVSDLLAKRAGRAVGQQ